MSQVPLIALALSALAILGATARADTIFEVEHARANARAGGPISYSDAEMLQRWGCLSGTRSPYCQKLRGAYKTDPTAGSRKRDRR